MNQIIQDIKDFIFIKRSWSYLSYIWRRLYYRYRLFKRFCTIPYYGAWEMVEPIYHYPFIMLCEFWEHCGKDIYDGEDQVPPVLNAKHEMEVLYQWYTVDRLVREEELEYLLHLWCDHHVSWIDRCQDEIYNIKGCSQYYSNPNNKYADYLFKLLSQEAIKFEVEKEDMILRLFKIRNFLWE